MEENIRLGDLYQIIIRRIRIIILSILIVTILSTIATFFIITPKYEAKGDIFVGNVGTMDESYTENDITVYLKMLKNYSEIMTKEDFIEKAIERDNIDIEIDDVKDELSVTAADEAQILTITFKYKDKYVTRDVVSAIIDEFIDESKDIIADSKVKVIQEPRLSLTQTSPNNKLNIIIGIVAGGIIGCAIAFMLDFNSDIFRNRKEFEEKTNLDVLGIIPLKNRYMINDPKCKDVLKDSYGVLRNNIEFYIEKKGIKSIVVTSAEDNDGKSIVAANLASAMSSFSKKVILIDCNLEKPSIHKIFKTSDKQGLKDIIFSDEYNIDDFIKHNHSLDILTCRMIKETEISIRDIQNKVSTLLRHLQDSYDIIIIDGGCINDSMYTQMISVLSDISIIVARENQSCVTAIKECKKIIEDIGCVLGGAVINESVLKEKAEIRYSVKDRM